MILYVGGVAVIQCLAAALATTILKSGHQGDDLLYGNAGNDRLAGLGSVVTNFTAALVLILMY